MYSYVVNSSNEVRGPSWLHCVTFKLSCSTTALTVVLSTDVDECAEGTHNCSNLCVNTPGGFQCGCPVGYQLSKSGLTCEGTGLVCLLKIADSSNSLYFHDYLLPTCL